MVDWHWPAAKPPPSHLLTFPQQDEQNQEKLVGRDKDSLINEGKNPTNQVVLKQSLVTSGQQTDAQPVSEQWLPRRNWPPPVL